MLLIILPIIIALAFKIGGAATRATRRSSSALATAGGFNFALFTEFAAVGFLLVVVVALFCGDTVASEASWASLRYLLAQPVPRSRLLRQKLIVAGAAERCGEPAAAGVGVRGRRAVLRLGADPFADRRIVRHRCRDVAAARQSSSTSAGSCSIVAALAFLLSVSVDNPLGAVGGAVMLVVISNILDQITALDPYRQYLPDALPVCVGRTR